MAYRFGGLRGWICPVAAMILMVAQAHADPGTPQVEPPPTPPGPSLELLDFIGSWVDDDGKWIDPADVATLPPSGKERKDDETD